MKRNSWFNFQNITIFIIVSWLLLFVFVPNFLVLITSFLTRDSSSKHFISFSFNINNYLRLFDELYGKVILNSLYMAVISTIICLVIGYPFAYILTKMPVKLRPLLLFLTILPFWTNSLIRIASIKVLLATKGLLNSSLLWLGIIDTPIRILNTQTAVIIGLVYILLPFMILPLYSSIENLDKPLLEAARDLGANKFQAFMRVILPLTSPGIIAGCVLVFLPAMGMFYVADMLGGANVLLVGNVIKDQFQKSLDWPFGSALSIGLTVLMCLLLSAYYYSNKMLSKKVGLE
ncbi:spermidine/putrescine ABC transporter permease [Gammaproteobacteria bacterium]|nr:spermidine/putrescine ABC transporter permease [Gammaproteobacteria bacterium]